MPRIGIYLRQSGDRYGDELAVGRQRANCLDRAAARGWTVEPEDIYVDNNVSAFHERNRPAYQRLIADIRAGRIDVVIAWNLDRLTRKPREIEDWIDLNKQCGVLLLTSEGSDPVDMSTESGRLVMRITAAVARQEVERKGRRQRESNEQARAMGFPPMGRRSFGYTARKQGARRISETRIGSDGTTRYPDYGNAPVPREADALRRGFDSLLAGKSVADIRDLWNCEGVLNTRGTPWTTIHVRDVLTDPQHAGVVASPEERESWRKSLKNPQDIFASTRGTWEPLIPLDTWVAAQAIMRERSARDRFGTVTHWLLSGIATCAIERQGRVCGALVHGSLARRAYHPIYHCSVSSHLVRRADIAEELAVATVVTLAVTLNGQEVPDVAPDPGLAALERNLTDSIYAVTNELGVLVRARILTPDEARVRARIRRGPLRAELAIVRRRLHGTKTVALNRLIVAGLALAQEEPLAAREHRVRDAWAALSLGEQRGVVEMTMAISLSSPGFGRLKIAENADRLAYAERSVHITLHEPFRPRQPSTDR